MKNKLFLLFISFIIISLISLISLESCSENKSRPSNPNNDLSREQSQNKDGSGSLESDAYEYPEINGGGADFKFLTPTTTWFYYTNLVFEEPQGEILDNAIYTRNRFVEDKFKINITAKELDVNEIYADLRTVVLSGVDVYDAAFAPAFSNGNIGGLITQNMFYNLRDISTLNLDEAWWNQTMISEASIGKGDKLYYAGCDINIMTLQSTTCVYFNEDMMINLGLDLPYNSVRQNKWTFDVFNQYMKAGAQLNGADSFAWSVSGTAIYGLTSYANSANALLMGAQEKYITIDQDGMPQLAIEGERFLNVLTKIQSMLSVKGDYLYSNGDHASGDHYEPIFRDGKAMMTMGELKAADVFKSMEATFGILPVPKYDENQQDYYCHMIFATPLLVVPSGSANPEFAGAVLDALAYVSAKDVTHVLFDVVVSQKRLRNEDSIEMLKIIKNSGSFEVGCAYGWTNDFYTAINDSIGRGSSFSAASRIERGKDKMITNIAKTMDMFED